MEIRSGLLDNMSKTRSVQTWDVAKFNYYQSCIFTV